MGQQLRNEQIYDAAIDDGAFSELARAVAADLGARSGVISWHAGTGRSSEVSDTQYFTEEQMGLYDERFSKDDLWSKAVETRPGRAWRCEQLVSVEAYANSRIFNDWIRQIGDDSFYCVGAAIEMDGIVAKLGFHRGKAQGSFDDTARERLNGHLRHISKAIQVRSKIAAAEAGKKTSSEMLNALAVGVFTVSAAKTLIALNLAAERILQRADCLTIKNGRLVAIGAGADAALEEALARASSPSDPHGGGFSLSRPCGEPYLVSVISAAASPEGRRLLIIVTDPEANDAGVRARLKASFALTESEAGIAVLLSKRRTLAEIAAIRRSGVATIRVQVKNLAAKLGCSRQSEIVAIVKGFPELLSPDHPKP